MPKKYYDGFIIFDTLSEHLKGKKLFELIQAFADAKGVDAEPVRHGKWIKYAPADFPYPYHHDDYVSGLRMTDTPYAIQDVTNKDNPLMIEVEYGDLGKKKMIEMLTDWAERRKE